MKKTSSNNSKASATTTSGKTVHAATSGKTVQTASASASATSGKTVKATSNDSKKSPSVSIEKVTSRMEKLSVSNVVGYTFNDHMMLHEEKGHCESPMRISSIYNNIKNKGLLPKLVEIPTVSTISDQDLMLVHSKKHLELIESLQYAYPQIDNKTLRKEEDPSDNRIPDTFDNWATYSCAQMAAASLLNVVKYVHEGKVDSGFAIIRPPGHHAFNEKACGFCFYNNVAIAVKYAQKNLGYKRIAIVDWDVHHGNGSQEIFYNDPGVLFISLHRYDSASFYPANEIADYDKSGAGEGLKYNINIPWNTKYSQACIGDDEYYYAFENIVLPLLREYKPELIFVSSGFDAAENDPLGRMNITPLGYGYMTQALKTISNKIIIALEGGYNLTSLERCSEACIRALLGEKIPFDYFDYKLSMEELGFSLRSTDYAINHINTIKAYLKNFWPCLDKVENKVLITKNIVTKSFGIEEFYKNLPLSESLLRYLVDESDFNTKYAGSKVLKFTIGSTLYPLKNDNKSKKMERISYKTKAKVNGYYLSGVKMVQDNWNKYEEAFDVAHYNEEVLRLLKMYFRKEPKDIELMKEAIIALRNISEEVLGNDFDLYNVDLLIIAQPTLDTIYEVKIANIKSYSLAKESTKNFKNGLMSLEKLLDSDLSEVSVHKDTPSSCLIF